MVFKLKIFGEITFYAKKNEIFQSIKDKICVCYSVIGRGKNRMENQGRKKGGRKERKRREDSNVGKL